MAIIIVGGCILNGVFIGCCLQLYSFLGTIRGFSIFEIIIAFSPLIPALLISVLISARLRGKVDERTQVTVGFLLLAFGSFSLSFIEPAVSYWWLALPLFILGLGFTTASTHLTNVLMSHVQPDLVGTAAAINNAYTQVGSSFGATALAAGLLWFGSSAYAFATNLSAEQVRQYITQWDEIIRHTLVLDEPSLLPINISELGPVYKAAYAQGLGNALLVAGGICLVLAAITWFGFRQKKTKCVQSQ